MCRTDFWTLWEKARVACFKRTAWKHVYYQGWNRSPAQAGCMRQVLGPGALGRPRGIRLRGRWEGGSGWGTHVNPRLIHVNVWQKPLQFCKVVSLQLIKINEKRKEKKSLLQHQNLKPSILQCSAFLMVQLSHWYMTTGKKTEPLPKRSCFLILSYERRAGLQHMMGGPHKLSVHHKILFTLIECFHRCQ